jgi:threonine aldolase
MIDLRSDTVTRPTPAMLEAMLRAPVGDDVYGEDPAVNALQESLAAVFGKERGLFVPTGVMGNQLAIRARTAPGDEVIVEKESHIFNYETGAPAMMSAVQLHTVAGRDGVMAVEDIAAAVRPPEYYYPRSTMLCLENTHNRAGGTVYPLADLEAASVLCRERGIPLHLDGARIWNAHVATGIPLRAYGELVDTINVCFSKGLGAPIGSMLLGPADVIVRAHKFRKVFGGGMRQVGILAAAAAHAVEHHLPLLADDHARARRFASAIGGCTAFRVDPDAVQTNMVLLDFAGSDVSAAEAQELLADKGIAIGTGRASMLRAVFHLDISDRDTDVAITAFLALFA